MKAQRTPLEPKSRHDEWHETEDHLPRGDHRWREANRARLQIDIGQGRASRAQNDRNAAPKREHSAEIEEPRADDRNPGQRDECAGDARAPQRFAWNNEVREYHSENRNRRLENGGESGGNVKLSPEEQRVIEAKHQNAGPGEKFEIATTRWDQTHATD